MSSSFQLQIDCLKEAGDPVHCCICLQKLVGKAKKDKYGCTLPVNNEEATNI